MFDLKIFLCLILLFIQIQYNCGSVKPEEYLRKYGYLETTQRTEGAIIEALKIFQSVYGLSVTGVFDAKTLKFMSRPRCGNKDPVNKLRNRTNSRLNNKLYVLDGSKWTNYKITYKMVTYSQKLDQNKTLSELREAFNLWSSVTPMRFIHVTDAKRKVHLDIRFATKMHCCHPESTPDASKFDGPGGDLAHAQYPRFGGDIHFDDEEDFVFEPNNPTNPSLRFVAIHEIGHALGLEHSPEIGSIMFPQDFGLNKSSLDPETIAGIRVLYGNESIKLP